MMVMGVWHYFSLVLNMFFVGNHQLRVSQCTLELPVRVVNQTTCHKSMHSNPLLYSFTIVLVLMKYMKNTFIEFLVWFSQKTFSGTTGITMV